MVEDNKSQDFRLANIEETKITSLKKLTIMDWWLRRAERLAWL